MIKLINYLSVSLYSINCFVFDILLIIVNANYNYLIYFQDPRPVLPWTGIRNALEKGKKAAQINAKTGDICGEDDCLYLNLATNSLSGKKPVMVWFHGGAFAYSSGDLDYFGPDYFLKHDVVFVTFNYRVGIFGE